MTGQQAIRSIDRLLDRSEHRKLNDLESTIVLQIWEGSTYRSISTSCSYDLDYIKQIAARLWKLFSKLLGENICKSNIRSVLERYSDEIPFVQQLPLKFADLEKFIEERKPTENSICGMLDGFSNSGIKLIFKKDTLNYEAEGCHYCRQPIVLNPHKTNKLRITNLKVNLIIKKILPNKSIFRKEFDLNNLSNGYLDWCFYNVSNKQRIKNEQN